MVDRLVAIRIDLLGLLGGNDADLVILASVLPGCVVYRVDVQLGGGRLPSQFTQTLHELLLEIVGDIVLLAKEDNASL